MAGNRSPGAGAAPNLRHLVLFDQVVRRGSVSAAARAAHLSQPAVTQAAERALNPLIGKSLVVYATKPAAAAVSPRPAAAEKVHAAA